MSRYVGGELRSDMAVPLGSRPRGPVRPDALQRRAGRPPGAPSTGWAVASEQAGGLSAHFLT